MSQIKLEDLLNAGAHFGHHKSRWHPKMKPFIYKVAERSEIHIINLEKTLAKLEQAEDFLKKLASQGRKVLFVGTKRQAKQPVQEAAEACGMPYLTERWPGGAFTNFSTLKKQIKKLKDLEKKIASSEFGEYTKKEQLGFKREAAKLNKFIGGLQGMDGLPDAVLVVDGHHEKIAVREAQLKKVPIVAMLDTNTSPEGIDFPVPINDDAIKVIKLVVDRMAEVVKKNRVEVSE